MRYIYLIIVLFCFLLSCGSSEEEKPVAVTVEKVKLKKFNGNYNKTFNDLHNAHTAAALKNGIDPMACKDDTAKMSRKLVYLPKELPYYKTDELTHSVPYLVPKASQLMMKICVDFRDSLNRKKIHPHKLILTSITRTQEDVKNLTKRNINASDNSTHCYGTTFDISWKRFEKQNPFAEDVNPDKLKLVLGQVLYGLQQQDMCYIKHERKQACFHITVR